MATRIESVHRPDDLRRPFTLLDGMIGVAASAGGLGLIRFLHLGVDREFLRKIWSEPDWFFHSWAVPQLNLHAFLISAVAASISTPTVLIYRLRRPRPAWRRLAGQPGMAAMLAVLIAWMTTLSLWFAVRSFEPADSLGDEFVAIILGLAAVLSGSGVASRWGVLLLSRRWAGERSWIDRMGRLVGAGWLVLGLWAICLRMVC